MLDFESVLLGGDIDKNFLILVVDILDIFNLFKCYLDFLLNLFKKEFFDN